VAQPRLRADARVLSAQLEELAASLQPSEAHVAAQKSLFSRVEALVRAEWPDAQLLMYGSCANGFGGPGSDVDTCLALRSAAGSGEEAQERKRAAVARIAQLAEAAGGFSKATALTHARMPVAKLACAASGVSCDVCVNNFLAVCNTRLLRDYACIDPRLRQLVAAVKHWAKRRRVNEPYTGTLSSYCYVLMCIHLLQTRSPPILPCLQAMRHTFCRDVDGVTVGYCDDVRALVGGGARNGEPLAALLFAFFSYWSRTHDYGRNVVCVRTGGVITKHRKGWTTRVGTERHLICVEDPFEVSHDLGRVVDKRSIGVLRDEFERAERILRSEERPLETLFEEYVDPLKEVSQEQEPRQQ
jgi:DNA polymerase sigma